MPPAPILSRLICGAALLLALTACGGGADAADDSRPGFEPVTCSAIPSPCA
jgi:hypothetical protein